MKMMDHCRASLFAFVVFASGPVLAVELPTAAYLPDDLALAAAVAAVDQCRKNGHFVSVAVVNRAGLLKVQMRDERAGPHTVDSSLRKAYTAASMREPTQKMAQLAGRLNELQGLHEIDKLLLLGGGFPIKIKGEPLGGIGVGGAPGAELDEACARAGLRAIGADTYE